MSRIDELMDTLCPEGVPHEPMGEVGEFIRGSGLQKKDLRGEGTPAIHYGQVHTHYGIWSTETISFVDGDFGRRLRHAQPGDVILATTSEDDEAVGKATAWLGEESVAVSGDAFIYRHSLDPKYVSYFLHGRSFQDQKARYITGAKVRRISGTSLAKIHIPVPPLEVQQEIVRILDQFTQLEAELEAELEARQKQYAHYRSSLVSNVGAKSNVELLGDVFHMRAGVHIRASEISDVPTKEKPYPCFGGNGLRGYVSDYNYDEDILLVGRQGALCGNVHRASGKVYATEHAVVVMPRRTLDLRWAFHKLVEMDLNQYKTKSAQPGLAVNRLRTIPINVPALDKQATSGTILDKFDALVNDLSSGLPAEIAARRKQYEYYRDALLSFREIG